MQRGDRAGEQRRQPEGDDQLSEAQHLPSRALEQPLLGQAVLGECIH